MSTLKIKAKGEEIELNDLKYVRHSRGWYVKGSHDGKHYTRFVGAASVPESVKSESVPPAKEEKAPDAPKSKRLTKASVHAELEALCIKYAKSDTLPKLLSRLESGARQEAPKE